MKPRHILYTIWGVIALLGVICLLVPKGGITINGHTLRWPTLSEALQDESETDSTIIYSDKTWIVEEEDLYSDDADAEQAFANLHTYQTREIQPLQPKYHILESSEDFETNDEEGLAWQKEAAITSVISSTAEITSQPTSETKEEAASQETKDKEKVTIPNRSSTLQQIPQTTTPPAQKESSRPTTKSNIDSRKYLKSFYQALDSANIMPIRVVHYGDSQIEEDRITDILREHLQEKYGGGGVGLIPLHQTVPTRSIRQSISINGTRQTTKGGPQRYLIYGPRSKRQNGNDYGMMGQVAIMDSTLVAGSQDIIMNIEPANNKEKSHKYFNQVRIFTDKVKTQVYVANNAIPADPYNLKLYHVPDNTTRCQIHLKGKGKVYGISLETSTGVVVDNIPMRGCSGTIFTRMSGTPLINYFQTTNTRLIIMQYGGNTIPHAKNTSSIDAYVKKLRQQVQYMRACAPYASILFIGPSDMSTRIDGKMTTYPMIPYLDQELQKMALEEHIAYWSMYDAMGGKNSMVNWVEKGLAGGDHVHFTRTGANHVGQMLFDWISNYQ